MNPEHQARIYLNKGVARLDMEYSKCENKGCPNDNGYTLEAERHPARWAARVGVKPGKVVPQDEWEAEGTLPYSILTDECALLCDCCMGGILLALRKQELDIHYTDKRYREDNAFTDAWHRDLSGTECEQNSRKVAAVMDDMYRKKADEASQTLMEEGVLTPDAKRRIEEAFAKGDRQTAADIMMMEILPAILKKTLGDSVEVRRVVDEPKQKPISDDETLDMFDELSDAKTLDDLGLGDIDISYDN